MEAGKKKINPYTDGSKFHPRPCGNLTFECKDCLTILIAQERRRRVKNFIDQQGKSPCSLVGNVVDVVWVVILAFSLTKNKIGVKTIIFSGAAYYV